jgi:uncharacterized protein (DUF58 family)
MSELDAANQADWPTRGRRARRPSDQGKAPLPPNTGKWLLAALVVLAVSLAFDLGLLAYAMYALLGVMLVSGLVTRAWAENLSATRECNRVSANVGDTVAVVIELDNRGGLPVVWALVEDMLSQHAFACRPPKLEVLGSRLQVASLKGHARKALLYQLHCRGRGFFQIGPLVLETGDLFGLHRRYRLLTDPHFLLVYPQVVPLEGFDIASRRPIGEIRLTHRLYEDPTRIAGARPYELGDPLNRIHWRATARTAAVHSKIYEPTSLAGATLVLEFHRDAFDPKHEPYRSELAVTAAASLANALYEMGQQVGLVTNARDTADRIRQEGWDVDFRTRRAARAAAVPEGESQRLQPMIVETRRGPEQRMRILETLARVELSDGLPFAELVAETAGRLARDATVLAILPSASPATALALGGLRRRGFAVAAIVIAYHVHEYEQHAGLLAAEGIQTRQLKDQDDIVNVCREQVYR